MKTEKENLSGLTNDVPKKGDVYRHQNGIDYYVEGLARVDNDYQELHVIATGPDGVMWARPIGNFMGLRHGKPRFEKVDIKDYVHPGVAFSCGRDQGATVEFTSNIADKVVSALNHISAHDGSWTLTNGGALIISASKAQDKAEPTCESFAVVNGVTYLNQAEFDRAFLDLESLKVDYSVMDRPNPEAIRAIRVQGPCTSQPDDAYHWNKPEDLPPVGCTLLINVPTGTKVVTAGKEGAANMSYHTTKELIFNVFRVSHLADRAGEMEYRLPDNSTVTGRFPWTYP